METNDILSVLLQGECKQHIPPDVACAVCLRVEDAIRAVQELARRAERAEEALENFASVELRGARAKNAFHCDLVTLDVLDDNKSWSLFAGRDAERNLGFWKKDFVQHNPQLRYKMILAMCAIANPR